MRPFLLRRLSRHTFGLSGARRAETKRFFVPLSPAGSRLSFHAIQPGGLFHADASRPPSPRQAGDVERRAAAARACSPHSSSRGRKASVVVVNMTPRTDCAGRVRGGPVPPNPSP